MSWLTEWSKKSKAFSALKAALKEVAINAVYSVDNAKKHEWARTALKKVLDVKFWSDKRIDRLIKCAVDIYKFYKYLRDKK